MTPGPALQLRWICLSSLCYRAARQCTQPFACKLVVLLEKGMLESLRPLPSRSEGSQAVLLWVEMSLLKCNLAGARCRTAAAVEANPNNAQHYNCICKKKKKEKREREKVASSPLLGITDVAVILFPSLSGCRCSVLILCWVLYRDWNVISESWRSSRGAVWAHCGSDMALVGSELTLCNAGGAHQPWRFSNQPHFLPQREKQWWVFVQTRIQVCTPRLLLPSLHHLSMLCHTEQWQILAVR